jgi:hypothetical protein
LHNPQLRTRQKRKLARSGVTTTMRIELGLPHDFFNKELVQAYSFGGMKDKIDRH